MSSNYFGQIFKITTWGESHGKAIGVVIDGCPAGVTISDEEINSELAKRSPGQNPYTSPRNELDQAEILSGVFAGQTTGAPLSIIIWNQDADSSKYDPIKQLLRPGHANYTYLEKYGVFDYRGGGRASARETACRVAAGAVAKKILTHYKITPLAYLDELGGISANIDYEKVHMQRQIIQDSFFFCPDPIANKQFAQRIEQAKAMGDSVGGVVGFVAQGLPVGLGDPVYEKIEANLAKAMLTIPASKAFSIGEGFASAAMLGSEHNDSFIASTSGITLATNHAGGTLGGISTGDLLRGRVAFKPTSSIKLAQQTVNVAGEPTVFQLPEGSRHDPCVAIRAVPVVEAMLALVLVDALLLNRVVRLKDESCVI